MATSVPVNIAPPMARPIASPITRSTAALIKKRGQPAKSITIMKQVKKSQIFLLLDLFRFSSSISCQGWEVFHQIRLKSSGFPPPSLVRVGRFFTKYTQDLSVFLLSIPLGQKVFCQLILYLLYHLFGARSMIFRSLVFLLNLFICRLKVFSSISQIKYQTTLIEYTLNGACA